jgi:hypothetical protein
MICANGSESKVRMVMVDIHLHLASVSSCENVTHRGALSCFFGR